MLSNERDGSVFSCVARAFHILGRQPFAGDKILVSCVWVFFSIHAWFLFLCLQKTQLKAIRFFRVYTKAFAVEISEKRPESTQFDDGSVGLRRSEIDGYFDQV